jgi:hypothetical protein
MGSVPGLLVVLMWMMVLMLVMVVPLRGGIGGRSLHRLSVCFDLYVDYCSLPFARW